jgi:hypothetical protein
MGEMRQMVDRFAVIFDMETHEAFENTDLLAGWSTDEIVEKILRVEDDESIEIVKALNEYHNIANKIILSGYPYDSNMIADVQAAYKQLDALLARGNPLRQILEIQMTEFGGAPQ